MMGIWQPRKPADERAGVAWDCVWKEPSRILVGESVSREGANDVSLARHNDAFKGGGCVDRSYQRVSAKHSCAKSACLGPLERGAVRCAGRQCADKVRALKGLGCGRVKGAYQLEAMGG